MKTQNVIFQSGFDLGDFPGVELKLYYSFANDDYIEVYVCSETDVEDLSTANDCTLKSRASPTGDSCNEDGKDCKVKVGGTDTKPTVEIICCN
ncbi:MAG: hypothetical protein K9H61_06785 [Bacteroidia bacterium]|nr:hypothetical protein [Bacteroidia bacterium]MCF8428057.1 hypothetical protein [Bacteroidia bacterium]MCF8446684.1 hypothetical protein [Bacteroidia bacterium]